MKVVYGEWSKVLWDVTTKEEKKLAKKIYKKCIASTEKTLKFNVERPNIVANAIGVMFLRFDNFCGCDWFKTKKIYTQKSLIINTRKLDKIVARNIAIQNELNRLKNQLKLRAIATTEFEKVETIHKYICDSVDYNYEPNSARGYSLHHTLFDKVGICCGYSLIFKALCDCSGIECNVLGNDDHAWNELIISGKKYLIDVTWDDTLNSKAYYMQDEAVFYSHHPAPLETYQYIKL